MNNQVYIVSCLDYGKVDESIDRLVSMMGGMTLFVQPNERIVLKPNLLLPAKPEQAVTTHPRVVAAIARMVKKEGAFAVIADSPGSGYKYNEKALNTLYRKCGMYEAAEESGAELNFDTTYKPVSFLQGKLIKHFDVIAPVMEADAVLNLCKLKTHVLMGFTGAVKNNFGVIPGLAKPGYHAKLHDQDHFADMLLDLAEYVSPRLSIMDAVTGMEGDGPGAAGTPRQIGLLLGSKNPLALDIIAGEIIGLRREQNPLLIAAENRRLAPAGLDEIEVIGAEISKIRASDYRLPATAVSASLGGHLNWWQKPLEPFFKSWLSQAPQVIRKKCIECGICRDSCPMNAITIIKSKRKYARIDDKQCIRCYCCHELCPEEAIALRQSLMHQILGIGVQSR
jgi:uncharacterized protein (DUF362 family)/Pyruvate/2-oxoacid:ferredoxin oxidoreductase delta subunit